eukprot:CAMPEP_0174874772 /NCGR_PEP_ID=MMETSP1114-20130205/77316_1 /TAXON_ID=312471 /ORGANISM="Neobodo designis, Strain CCAP 1951/1" /LENGTH=59 /DNA_ID=CAMNT_0016110117 /DNA_START=27 /DNA_END=206 /DNA_ORIENTATION=+
MMSSTTQMQTCASSVRFARPNFVHPGTNMRRITSRVRSSSTTLTGALAWISSANDCGTA